jgi:hypothetical protein
MAGKTLLCAWPITYKSREKSFKVVAVIILVQGKTMLSLLKVVLNIIALVIQKSDEDN